ncbi:hypothetical protein RclHR1_01120016 [Rhizophagus clarus]|uniref:Kinase-like domain-containing protein n=1 Tax=Rhizophagus clarus TaxID=94130 RepID=A0A2Z6QVD3_9GLOM|nr:hypothetical protein RclHR1_01120016 [Rhizophagus clarus]GET04558.1 kinase-like domain-containing protein [Rhizophagus clarus]
MEAQKYNYRDFKYNSILSAGESKKDNCLEKPKLLDEFLIEIEIYKVLAKLQGIYIPELLFYADLSNAMSFVMGMTIVGTILDHHRINND